MIVEEANHIDYSHIEDVKEVALSIKARLDMIFKQIECEALEENKGI